MAGKAQDRKTVMISTGDSTLAGHYCNILESNYQLEVIDSIDQTLAQLTDRHPALLILDPRVSTGEVVATITDILDTERTIRLIVVEPDNSEELDQHALFKAGAHGFCNHDISSALLSKAVQLVLEGEYWIQRKLITQVISELARDAGGLVTSPDEPGDSLINTLTPRELQVARMVHMGGNNKMIARELEISERTVKAHLSAIFRKLDIQNRLHLALYFSGRT